MNVKEIWDLSPLFKGDDDPAIELRKKEVAEAVTKFSQKWKNREDYLKDPRILKEALDEFEKHQRIFGCEGGVVFYFSLRSSQEENNPAVKAKYGQALEFARKMDNELRFFTLRLGEISPQIQKKILADNTLAKYKHYLERVFIQAKYMLSEPEENILNLKADVSYTHWVDMVRILVCGGT